MMACGVSFWPRWPTGWSFEHCTQGTPLLLDRHRPQLLVIAPRRQYQGTTFSYQRQHRPSWQRHRSHQRHPQLPRHAPAWSVVGRTDPARRQPL